MVSRYLHLMEYSVALGEKVTRGQKIGLSNNTGNSQGPHLHFEIRVPEELLPRIEATVGRPTIGWGDDKKPYGVGIAPDSWIPVDEYRASTLANVRRYKIPLYGEWPGSGGSPKKNFTKLPRGVQVASVAGLAIFSILIGLGLYRRKQHT
jgi:murein DD-endopeptidase MepM/ murein hydrolase activator NlpD